MFRRFIFVVGFLSAINTASAGQFVVELSNPLETQTQALLDHHDVFLNDILSAGSDSYAIFTASNIEHLIRYLDAAAIYPEKISDVLFVNSPTIGGGQLAPIEPRPGHQVFVVERPIPGVGFFGFERKQQISENSNDAIAMLGSIIEWDRSYLTSEGTYCLYRADSTETLREHGALAGAPIGKITPVTQVSFVD